jgi:hypothetical protein
MIFSVSFFTNQYGCDKENNLLLPHLKFHFQTEITVVDGSDRWVNTISLDGSLGLTEILQVEQWAAQLSPRQGYPSALEQMAAELSNSDGLGRATKDPAQHELPFISPEDVKSS